MQPIKRSQPRGNNAQPKLMADNLEYLSDALSALESLDEDKRTVDCVFFTGKDVSRYDYWKGEPYIMRFARDGADLSLLNNSAPVLDNHDSFGGAASQKGVVQRAWRDGEEFRATLRFSKRGEVDGLWQDITDRIVSKFSMGVSILEKRDIAPEKGKLRVVEVTKWQPFEISVAPIPADFDTRTLTAEPGDAETIRATSPKENEMADLNPTITGAGEARPEINLATERTAAANAERARVLGIAETARRHGIDATLTAQHVESGSSIEQFGIVVLNELAKRAESEATTQTHRAHVTRDHAEGVRLGMEQAILWRASGQRIDDTQPGRQYIGLASQGLIALAAECVRLSGGNPNSETPMNIARLAMSTSDFPLILASIADKSMMAGYAKYRSQWPRIAARKSAPNFKTQTLLDIGLQANYELVAESGEFKLGYVSESQETWRLFPYGKRIAFTRQTIINDDLGALTDIPAKLGLKAAQKQAALVWSLVTANLMSDGATDLFSTGHANYTSSGTAISVDSIGVGRKTMRVQADPDGDTASIEPAFIVVPAAKEQLALQYTSNNYVPAQATNQNVWAGLLTPIVEPRLDANSPTAWYLFADPSAAPVIVYGYLDGQEGIHSESRQGFEVDGVEFKVRMDFGCAVVGYRGAYKNAGA